MLDASSGPPVTYVVSEHLRGRDLARLVDTGPLPAETARRLVGEAAEVLDRAQSRGLAHLRLRPQSLVLLQHGAIKIIGTAVDAAVDGVEPDGPDTTAREDAVGLVRLLYAALTARWPGPPTDGLDRAPRIGGGPVPPGELVSGVPRDLDLLCTETLGPANAGPRTPAEVVARLSPWVPAERWAPLHDLAADRPTATPAPFSRPGPAPAAAPIEAPAAAAPARAAPVLSPTATEEAAPTVAFSDTPRLEEERTDLVTPRPVPGGSTEPLVGDDAVDLPVAGSPTGAATQTDVATDTRPDTTTEADVTTEADTDTRPETTVPARDANGTRPPVAPPGARRGLPTLPPATPSLPILVTEVMRQAGIQPVDDEHEEPLTATPTDDESRFVLGIVAGVVVVGLIIAIFSLRGLGQSGAEIFGDARGPLIPTTIALPSVTDSPQASASASATPTASASVSPSATPSAEPPGIAGVIVIDPEGDDGGENDERAPRAIDGDPSSSWRSSEYKTEDFSGLKSGMGIVLELDSDGPVTEVAVDSAGDGGTIELRTAENPDYEGSTLVATSTVVDGKAVLTPTRPVSTDFLVLWCTGLPRADGEYRLNVFEIRVR